VRRALAVLAGIALVLGVAVGVSLVLSSRDDAGVGSSAASGPGELQKDLGDRHLPPGQHIPPSSLTDPPTSGPHHPRNVTRDGVVLSTDQILHALELGDVILFYDAPRPPAQLRALQNDVSGPFDAEVAAAGQQVILARRPGTDGVVAAAWRRLLRAPGATDPALRAFAEAWVGRGVRG
jgi:Protein of unknown function (DUF3105)